MKSGHNRSPYSTTTGWVIAVIVVISALWAYNHYTDQKKADQADYNCEQKTWYKIPDVMFKDRDAAANDTAVSVSIKRKGNTERHELKLKRIKNAGRKIDYQLTSNDPDSATINKSDTIYISFQNEKHRLYGFKSYSYLGDHGIPGCGDAFIMDGKAYNYYNLRYFYKTDPNN